MKENKVELIKMLEYAAIIALALCLLALIPLFAFGQPGWLIGVAIGSVIEIINLFLLFKGSEVSLKKLKVTMYMLFYFLRMVLFLAGILITAIFSFGFTSLLEPVPEMANSIWGVVIAYAPMQVIVFVVMKLNHKNTVTIAEQDDKKE